MEGSRVKNTGLEAALVEFPKMDNEDKVFSSDIERGQRPFNNNLYELLHFDPAKPNTLKCKQENGDSCDFQPKSDKNYVPKKRSKFSKVKTVRDLRKEFEEQCQSYLPEDILTQQNHLFANIRNGSLRRDKTIRLAKSLLKGDNPLSRATWQMLTNINPHKHNHSTQCVLWNGTRIRVNGSIGGEKKFICNYDLAKKKIVAIKNKTSTCRKQKSLLKTLTVDFKPGPLSRKKHLDKSYQKFNVGETELVKLPKIGLEVQPQLGVPIEPTISDILASNRLNNDEISENWALFAVSTLGTVHGSGVKQVNNESITFDMSYTHDQNKILMRRDLDISDVPSLNCERQTVNNINGDNIISEVNDIVKDMLNAVEISMTQEEMYTGIDEPREKSDQKEALLTAATRDKPKKKLCELKKLDVTVIRLSDSPAETISCTNPACTLGCFCASLENKYNLKNHCGRFDCMFECKCDFTNYKVSSNIDDQNMEFIPGLLNLDSKINLKLAKEEKKFHQTVVLTQNDSILLKTKRRSLKTPKRYAEFVKDVPKNSDSNRVSIMVSKLDCKNIEPWCMVHNLYKCFCKGRFTESLGVTGELKDNDIDHKGQKTEIISPPKTENDESSTKTRNGVSRKSSISSSASNPDVIYEGTTYISTCARTKAFKRRRYSDLYYSDMKNKIIEMEANDKGLQKKLMAHVQKLNEENNCHEKHQIPNDGYNTNENTENGDTKRPTVTRLSKDSLETTNVKSITPLSRDSTESTKSTPNKAKLITWLEANYKHYKNRVENGQKHIPLEAPKLGKIALYPWEVILERYKLRKNFFVVTQEPPYRIYVAVDLKSPFLANCINIDRIPFEDLRKYPMTVKNLLDDATDMKDNFYILCGLAHCWELIGSVTKLRDRINSDQADSDAATSDTSLTIDEIKPQEKVHCSYSFQNLDSDKVDDFMATTAISKWFFMMIENDFSEIQFHSRGFFVKHENILKAVNVARASGKTVRLSAQKFNQSNDSPQFGIYAIPHETNVCAFVGPYEKDDLLEIETLMRKSYAATEMRSRGVWITTKKSDDIKVIDEPLLFLPQMREGDDIITLDKTKLPIKRSSSDTSYNTKETADPDEPPENVSTQNSQKIPSPVKAMKTIKVRRVFSMSTGSLKAGFLKPVSLLRPVDNKDDAAESNLPNTSTCAIAQESFPIPVIKTTFSLSEVKNCNRSLLDKTKIKPVAEIAPQMKTYSKALAEAKSTQEQCGLRGMLILKPEEINQRHSENKLFSDLIMKDESDIGNNSDNNGDTFKLPSDMDIENFLATSEICAAPTIESIYVVSDEDTNDNTPKVQDIWIECQNIPNLGYLRGKKDSKNELSFQFPGFKFTNFYPEVEAFTKINQVLSRKVYIPKQLKLEWKVIDREAELTTKRMLNAAHLSSHYVLTETGLINKRDARGLFDSKASLSMGLQCLRQMVSPKQPANPVEIVEEATNIIKDLEAESKNFESQLENLRTETSIKKSELLSMILRVPKEVRKKVTKNLREISD